MSEQKVLMLITSPFQYLCAMEWLSQHAPDAAATVVDASSGCQRSSAQLHSLYRQFAPAELLLLALQKQGDLAERIESYAWLGRELQQVTYQAILIGNIRQQWMQDLACTLRSDMVIVVDDGAATLPLHDYILKPAAFRLPVSMYQADHARRQLAHDIKVSAGLHLRETTTELYSIYRFAETPSQQPNQLTLLRQQWQSRDSTNTEWHFIGSPVTEKNILSAELYRDIVRDAMLRQPAQKRAVYFAHRAEDMAAKAEWLQQLGFSIEITDLPYELHLASQGKVPTQIVGLHSTCLFNLKLMFGAEVDACCYVLSDAELAPLKQISWASDQYSLYDHITSIYRRLAEFNIGTRQVEHMLRRAS